MGFPNGDIKISNNFELNTSLPLDARTTVATIANRDAIDFKYIGLLVFVSETEKLYSCINTSGGGIWKIVGGDSFSGITQTQFSDYSGLTDTKINSKLNISDFNSYSSSTNTRINVVENQYLSGATNQGNGFGLYNNSTNKNLNFNTLSGGTNVTLSQIGNVIKIDSASGGGGTGTTIVFTTITQNLGTTPKKSGSFNISGTGFTIGKQVIINMATGTSGNEDDLEWDFIVANGIVVSSTIIKVYWSSSTFVKGNKNFNYLISS